MNVLAKSNIIRLSGLAIAAIVSALVCRLLTPDAAAAQLQANPQTYRALLPKLQAGDELLLEPGVYRNGLPLHGVQGTAAEPIIIRGPVNGTPAVFVARPGANTVSLAHTAHVQIHNLHLDGNNLYVDAIKAEGGKQCTNVHHITLQDLMITGHGANQGLVSISTKCPAWNWIIRGNIIVGAGTGLYLGNSDGSAAFVGGLIEGNIVLDAVGYGMQIKHQVERAAGMPTEPAKTIIRHNLFAKASNSSRDKDARPNLLVGHFPRQGPGSDDTYDITDNVLFCNPTEALLQAEGNVTARGNVVLNPAGPGIHIQPHNDVPKNIDVTRNFIATAGRGVALVKPSPLHKQTIADNKIIAPETTSAPPATQPAPLPEFSTALAQWLDTRGDHAAFEPLARTASRMCSTQVDAPYARMPWLQGELRDHPVCALVSLLSAPRAGAARLQALEGIIRTRCTL